MTQTRFCSVRDSKSGNQDLNPGPGATQKSHSILCSGNLGRWPVLPFVWRRYFVWSLDNQVHPRQERTGDFCMGKQVAKISHGCTCLSKDESSTGQLRGRK
jgi:hypothetical protein